ncbi:hypothetical protein ACFL1H_01170 [Nanoarchaeota archaeon]
MEDEAKDEEEINFNNIITCYGYTDAYFTMLKPIYYNVVKFVDSGVYEACFSKEDLTKILQKLPFIFETGKLSSKFEHQHSMPVIMDRFDPHKYLVEVRASSEEIQIRPPISRRINQIDIAMDKKDIYGKLYPLQLLSDDLEGVVHNNYLIDYEDLGIIPIENNHGGLTIEIFKFSYEDSEIIKENINEMLDSSYQGKLHRYLKNKMREKKLAEKNEKK